MFFEPDNAANPHFLSTYFLYLKSRETFVSNRIDMLDLHDTG